MTIDQWTSGADYDRWMGRWSRLLACDFLAWLSLPAGLRWIDICCGSGILSETVFERNAPASVVGVDISSEQIEFARQHRGRESVTFEIGSAMSMRFSDESFDVAVCGIGLNYLPNPGQALEEFRRVVCPGGTVAIYVWDYEEDARFLREFWDAAVAIDPEATAFDQARRFPMCRPEGLRALFAKAKLEAVTTHALDIVTRFTSFDDYWEPILRGQGSAPGYLATRDPKTRAKIRERLRAALPNNDDGTIELPARGWAVRARRS